jgi:hypothetical protein
MGVGELKQGQVAFMIGVVGLGIMWKGFRRFRIKQLLEDLPTSKIGFAAQGLIEIQGRALPFQGKFYSTFRGEKTVYLNFTLQQWTRNGKKSEWQTIQTTTLGEEFLIEDPSGVAHVEIKGADLELKDEVYQTGTPSWPAEITMPSLFSLQQREKYRVLEKKIVPGSEVTVIGSFKSGGFKKDSKHPFIIGDGHQDSLLKRTSYGAPTMILGAALVAAGVYLFVVKG